MEYTKEELIEKIKYYADAYYSGREEISDANYDALIEQLRVLDPENELIAGLAGDEDEAEANAAGYKKVDHILTTGTLSKCMTVEAFKEWSDKHPIQYHVSAKEDGCSMELVYRNGILFPEILLLIFSPFSSSGSIYSYKYNLFSFLPEQLFFIFLLAINSITLLQYLAF